jgi:hypothetical protein
MVVLLALGVNTLLSNASQKIKVSIYLSWGALATSHGFMNVRILNNSHARQNGNEKKALD